VFSHPCVVVGIEQTIPGLAALRAGVEEARRRRIPLVAVRTYRMGFACTELQAIAAVFLEALGGLPDDVKIYRCAWALSFRKAMHDAASDPRDLIVVADHDKGLWRTFWSGSGSRSLIRAARCPIPAVPAPEAAHSAGRRKTGRTDDDLWAQFEQAASEQAEERRIED
jgi:hypothetical protein